MASLFQKIIDAFKSKSAHLPQKYTLGAFPNEPDNRDIAYPLSGIIATDFPAVIGVQNAVTLMRLQQGNVSACVEYTFEFIKRNDDGITHSRRFGYAATRQFLNYGPLVPPGLPQREAAKVAVTVGMPQDAGYDDTALSESAYAALTITPAMRTEANLYRFGGFAFPAININSFKQALLDGHIIAATIAIDWDQIDVNKIVHPPVSIDGYHEVAIYLSANDVFSCANWWGFDLYIEESELSGVVKDAIIFTDIPEDMKQRAKLIPYIFQNDLKIGSTSPAVAQLQSRLTQYGLFTHTLTNYFGPITQDAVRAYQRLKGIQETGFFGPITRAAMNTDVGNGQNAVQDVQSPIMEPTKDKITLWCEAAIEMEGARKENNNPGNIRVSTFATNRGATGSYNGFATFQTYEMGYNALKELFTRACMGKSSNYKADESLYEFYTGINIPNRYNKVIYGYAPSTDGNDPGHYAEVVARHIGVSPTTQLQDLL